MSNCSKWLLSLLKLFLYFGNYDLFTFIHVFNICIIYLLNFYLSSFSEPINSKPKKEDADDDKKDNAKVGIIVDIKKELKRSGIRTTLHGVPNLLLSNRKYIKIIWAIFTLLSIGFCIFMTVRAITNYLQFEVKSQIRQVPQKSITFPSIQFCNPNFLATREASAYLNEYYLKKQGINVTNLDEYFASTASNAFWPFYLTFSPNFNMTLRRSLGYSLEEMVLKCEFNSKPCNLSWFDWYYHPFFGNCYRFNTGYLNGGK